MQMLNCSSWCAAESMQQNVYLQKFMRRRKYKLHTAFLNASMISAIDAPIEFEVSIGNYGNKLDELLPPCVCTTQPTNAVFDGCFYYFLPWGDTKPCVDIDCHWEDISFRLEALNMILGICERLVSTNLILHVVWFVRRNAMHCISPYAIVVCVCVCVYAAFVDLRKTV